jgi:hypothetical protein
MTLPLRKPFVPGPISVGDLALVLLVIQEERGVTLSANAIATAPELLLITQPANANVLQQRRIIIKMQEQAQVHAMNARKISRISGLTEVAMYVPKLRHISGLTGLVMNVPKLRRINGLMGVVINVRRRIRTPVMPKEGH